MMGRTGLVAVTSLRHPYIAIVSSASPSLTKDISDRVCVPFGNLKNNIHWSISQCIVITRTHSVITDISKAKRAPAKNNSTKCMQAATPPSFKTFSTVQFCSWSTMVSDNNGKQIDGQLAFNHACTYTLLYTFSDP